MAASVDYYFSVASPWAYLGSARFRAMAEAYEPSRTMPHV